MAKTSTIKTLPSDILEQLQALLRDPRVTQLDATQRINAILAEQGQEPVSKSAVNRYAMRMADVGKKLQESRAIAEMWIGKLGSQPAGEVGKLLNEVVRNLAFDAAMHMAEDENPAHPGAIKELAIAIEKLENAASKNEQRDALIRKQALEEATNKAADIAKRSGLTADAIATFKREMLGVPA
ncbi:MAG: DUF3486 family protein [Methylobacter tundripaludum]|nr:DUF3486 family protein [Methylobacter tundripaludum]